MQINISFKGELINKLKNFSMYSELSDAVKDASTHLMEKIVLNTPASTGNLRKSITRELYPLKALIYPTTKYGYWVHEGTGPHWVPKSEMLPGGSLYRWAQKKSIPVFLVARAIAKKGTKAQPWISNTAKDEADNIQEFFQKAINKVVAKLAD